MKLERAYCGCFTRPQVDKLQSMLCLDDHESAFAVAAAISGALLECDNYISARRAVPVPSDVRTGLRETASYAQQLARCLREDPGAWTLINPIRRYTVVDDEGVHRLRISLLKEAGRRFKDLPATLQTIVDEATRQQEDKEEFLQARMLLPNVKLTKLEDMVATRILWPALFDLWTAAGKQVASTENGPMHRFIAFVHEVADLPEPKRGALRGAIEKRKKTRNAADRPAAGHG